MVMAICKMAASADEVPTTEIVISVLLGGTSLKVSVTADTDTPSTSAMICAIIARSAAVKDADSPASCTTDSTMFEAGPVAEMGTDVTVTVTGVLPPVSTVATSAGVPRMSVMFVLRTAAAEILSATTVIVIIVLLGGASVNVSVTDDTGTPSAEAIDCAIAVRSSSEMVDESPSS